MTDWTSYCDTGSCVVHQVHEDHVLVWQSAEPSTVLTFTAEEWAAFVDGLLREEKHARRLNEAVLGAEIAKVTAERDGARQIGDRVVKQRNEAVAEAAVLRHRDRRTQAVVEAAEAWWLALVPPPSPEAEDEWRRTTRQLMVAVDTYRQANPGDTPGEMVPGEDDVTDGPTAAQEAPQSVQEPSVGETGTDGLEAQGGAQRARGWAGEATCASCGDHWPTCPDCGDRFCSDTCLDDHRELGTCPKHADGQLGEAQGTGVVWHHPCGRTATTSPGVALVLECECGTTGGWVTYSNSAGMVDTRVDEGTTIKVTWRTPRVWNAGDPEPEGVARVADRDGDEWARAVTAGWWDLVDGPDSRPWVRLGPLAPLTEVLPEPAAYDGPVVVGDQVLGEFAPVADNDHDPDGMESLREHTIRAYADLKSDPDGVVPEAVLRAKARSCPTCHSIGTRRAECNNLWHVEVRDLDNRHGFVATATAVPEAGRAGEAQTSAEVSDADQGETQDLQQREDQIPGPTRREDRPGDVVTAPPQQGASSGLPLSGVQGLAPDVEAQDRTEVGLDAAIEAAWQAYRDASGPAGHHHAVAWAVRAASPLIEAAALHAAVHKAHLCDDCRVNIRGLATRTGGA